MKRAQIKKLVSFNIVNIRDHARDKHKKVDDRPYGGGPGMILKMEPIYNALRALDATRKIKNQKSKIKIKERIILLSAKGKLFTQNEAKRLSKYDRIILICGRYEGVDERVAKYLADEELSIGPYVLTGGELPAMVILDAVSRIVPGVLGKAESLKEESYESLSVALAGSNKKLETRNLSREAGSTFGGKLETTREYPQYTRPEIFSPKKGLYWRVPKVLLCGNHKKIKEWRHEQRKR